MPPSLLCQHQTTCYGWGREGGFGCGEGEGEGEEGEEAGEHGGMVVVGLGKGKIRSRGVGGI